MSWEIKAACRDADPELFAPKSLYSPSDWEDIRDGASSCNTCPVVAECGRFADAHRYQGTWGGTHRRIKQSEYTWRVLTPTAYVPAVGRAESEQRVREAV